MTDYKLSADSRKRIETMVQTNNGFQIAEVDMRLRGTGNIFGTQQSGTPINFRIANLLTDGKILAEAMNKDNEQHEDNADFTQEQLEAMIAKLLQK